MVAEVLRKEEVLVLLIVGHVLFKRRKLHATLRGNAFGGRLLLGNDGLQLEFTKLQIGAEAEKTAGSTNE